TPTMASTPTRNGPEDVDAGLESVELMDRLVLLHGVRAQDLEERGAFFQGRQGTGYRLFVAMADKVQVEIVFPLPGACGPGLEPAHRHIVVRQGRKHVVDGARPIRHCQDEAGLVMAAGR